MDHGEDLTNEQFTQALSQAWASAPSGGTDLLTRMRDSIAEIDTTSDKPKITKEEFLAELAQRRR